MEYSGSFASDQSKHFVLVNYDVGNRDLQQCADFLMRLRAEYLFQSGRANEISFRFTSGQAYSFQDHCKGLVPVVAGSKVTFRQRTAVGASGTSLRKYLDLVYSYAGTVSLHRDLAPARGFEVGTVIISPGSPGHCMIIVDEMVKNGKKYYKLAESFMPAQTPYILKNPKDGSPWHELIPGGRILTASYHFAGYDLRKFE